MVAGQFNHIRPYILQQFDIALVAAKTHAFLNRVGVGAVFGKRHLVTDVGDIGILQPTADIPSRVGDAMRFHGEGRSPY